MKCEIIRDLLPVYCDGLASEETREEVNKHIEDCEDCRERLRLMREAVPEVPKADIEPMKKIKRSLRLRLALVIGMVLIVLFAGAYNMLVANPMAISSRNIEVTHYANGQGSKVYICEFKMKGQTRYSSAEIQSGSEVIIDKENDCVCVDGEKLAVASLDYEPVYAPADGELYDGGLLIVRVKCDTLLKAIRYDYPLRYGEFAPAEQELTLRPCLPFRQNMDNCIGEDTFVADFPAYQCGEGAKLTIHCRDKDVVVDLHELAVEEGLLTE
ncbi:MAG: zf-HC2 domain-containing protein [Ruminococcus sp.]|nr:zf-HC2 domain-containing protein [Ruminococcus sp.]